MRNLGKVFEEDFKKSFDANFWVYKLRDNAASFSGGASVRFASNNICDYIVWAKQTQNLSLVELKSTSGSYLPYTMIRDNQIEGLTKASDYNINSCFIFNFREYNNATYFLTIENFNKMRSELQKKSFNISDLKKYGAIYIESNKKRTRYTYDVGIFG